MTTNLLLVYKMEKRDRPPKGFYKSLEGPVDFLVDRSRCQKKPNILGVFQAERVVAKKIRNEKPSLWFIGLECKDQIQPNKAGRESSKAE